MGLSSDEKYKDGTLVEYITKQNRHLFATEEYCEVVSFAPLRKNAVCFRAVVQVNKNTYDNAMKNGYMIDGYDYCAVYDGVDLRRCYNCCGFHHFAKQCLQKKPTCPRCSAQHPVSECKSDELSCMNCVNFNNKYNKKININHGAWDHASCHAYQHALSDFKSNLFGAQ